MGTRSRDDSRRTRRRAAPAAVLLTLLATCGDQPTQPEIVMAVAIDDVSPRASAAGDSLELRVEGAGFRAGASVSLERGGNVAAGVQVHETRFVGERELVATVDIDSDTEPHLYDVVVRNPDGTTASAGGIFEVEPEPPPIIVSAAQPAEAGRTETVQVRIYGSGFREGDAVAWERHGVVDPGVVVQESEFVNEEEIVVTIQVQPDAAVATYDVVVSRPRRRGIGSELFDVVPGLGSELEAMFRFTYDGYRSGSFHLDHTFILDPERMETGSWGLTYFVYEQNEQFLGAHYLQPDGLLDMMWCWVPGGRVREPGTRALECWFTPGYNPETGEYGDPEDYTAWVEGDRPGDGTGQVHFTSVSPERLAGTFSITMHVVDWHDWLGSPSITIEDGEFDLPVVSSYWDQGEAGDHEGDSPDPPPLPTGSEAKFLNDHGVVIGTVRDEIGTRTVRWTVGQDGTVDGPEPLGTVEGTTGQVLMGINNSGTVVGYTYRADPANPDQAAFIYDGAFHTLTNLEGALTSMAFGINDLGVVVGQARYEFHAPELIRGTVWRNPYDPDELPVPLPAYPDARVNYGEHINNHGVIVGFTDGAPRNVRWQLHEDGTISAPEPVGLDAVRGINDAGDVLGCTVVSGACEAKLLRAGFAIPLDPPAGYDRVLPVGLTSPAPGAAVLVAGTSFGDTADGTRVIIWSVNPAGAVAGPIDLGLAEGFEFGRASDINVHGWVAGTVHNGQVLEGFAALWRPRIGDEGYEVVLLPSVPQSASLDMVPSMEYGRCRARPGRPHRCR